MNRQPTEPASRLRALVLLLVATHALLLLVYTKHGVTSWQEGAMAAGVHALLSHGTLELRDETFGSGDLIERDGRRYAAKLPLFQVLGAAAFALPHRLIGLDLARDHPIAYYLLALLVTGSASTVLLALLAWVGLRRGAGWWAIFLGVGGLSLGSIYLAFSTVFYYHVVVALLLCAAVALLESPTRIGPPAAGVLCGLAAGMDFPLGMLAGMAFSALLLGLDRRAGRALAASKGLRLAAGWAVGLVPFALLNAWQLGTLLPYHLDPALFEYEGSRLAGADGRMGAFEHEWPLWVYPLWGTIGSQGLFSLSPITALWLWAAIRATRGGSGERDLARPVPLPALAWTVLALSAAAFVFYNLVASRATAWSYGQRFLIPVLALWVYVFLSAPPRLEAGWQRRWAAVLLLVSVACSFPGVFMPFSGAGSQPPPGNLNPLAMPLALWPAAPRYRDQDLARGYVLSAVARLRAGDAQAALAPAREAARRYPELGRARLLYAQCLWETGATDLDILRAEVNAAMRLGEQVPPPVINRLEWLARHPGEAEPENGSP